MATETPDWERHAQFKGWHAAGKMPPFDIDPSLIGMARLEEQHRLEDEQLEAAADWSEIERIHLDWMNGPEYRARVEAEAEAKNAAIARKEREQFRLIDWPEFWANEQVEIDWLVERVIPRGGQCVIYSKPGLGKSLLALELAVLLSLGETTLGKSKVDPVRVLYLDQENSQGDVRRRMESWGFDASTDLSGLLYSSLGDLPPLNTAEGGKVLSDFVERNSIEMVVIDTTSRVVEGDHNASNTITDLWQHTQMHLKREGVAVLRVDHSGKKQENGQLGSIMKAADQDAIWLLEVYGVGDVLLTCEKDRSGTTPVGDRMQLRRSRDPLRHVVVDATTEALDTVSNEIAILEHLQELGVPQDAGREKCANALRNAGHYVPRSSVLGEIIKRRKSGGVEA